MATQPLVRSIPSTHFTQGTEDGSYKTKDSDGDKPAELEMTILQRRMEKKKAIVIEYINNKKEADLLVDVVTEQKKTIHKIRIF